jgi:putative ABC transport system ATP-binding protein
MRALVADPGVGPIASARDLVKTYGKGEAAVRALDGVSVDLDRGEMTAIMGPSGSGKSTLMHCMAGLDTPTSGLIVVDGEDVGRMRQRALTRLRRTRLGFVFQAFNLIPTLTAAENITLPLDIARTPLDREWFDTVVDAVGLRDRLDHRPGELSGGQQQRVACARALISRPAVVFADEPTGNLDSRSSGEVLGFLRESVDQLGQAIVMVTHDPTAASYAHRVLFLADGRLVHELEDPTSETVLDALRDLGGARGAHAEVRPGATGTGRDRPRAGGGAHVAGSEEVPAGTRRWVTG